MNDDYIRQVVKDELAKNQGKNQFNVSKIPFHTHNGVDSANISEDNVILTRKLNTQLVATETAGPSLQSFSILNVPNISRVSAHGFAANNASAPATIRSTISGEAIFGRCYGFTGVIPSVVVSTAPQGTPFVQHSNGMTIDAADIANTRVFDTPFLAACIDSSAAGAALTAVGAIGATTGTLTGAWGGSTGNYLTSFSGVDAAQALARLVTFTNSSTAISWTGALPFRVQTPLTVGLRAVLYIESYTNDSLIMSLGLADEWRLDTNMIIE